MLLVKVSLFFPCLFLLGVWVWHGVAPVFMLGWPLASLLAIYVIERLEDSKNKWWDGVLGGLKGAMMFGMLGVFSFVMGLSLYGSVMAYPKLFDYPSKADIIEMSPLADSLDRVAVLGACWFGAALGVIAVHTGRAFCRRRHQHGNDSQPLQQSPA
ncbi:MAG TPA: hypothetical protein VF272_02475 [Candidatus Saccharimonadia bacterium]